MLTTAGIMVLGVVCDVAVVYYAKDLKIFDEGDKNKIVQTKMSVKYNFLWFPNSIFQGVRICCRCLGTT